MVSGTSFFIFILLLVSIYARKHGIEKSNSRSRDKVQLTILSEPRKYDSTSAPDLVHVVDVEVELLMTVVEWRELSLDGIQMKSCKNVKKNRRTKLEIEGGNIDLSDFSSSPNAFAITKLEWNSVCGKPIGSFSDISNEEELLCFAIISVKGKDGKFAMLSLKRINCATVASSVTATVRNEVVPIVSVPGRSMYTVGRVSDLNGIGSISKGRNLTLSPASRPTVTLEKQISLSTDEDSTVSGQATFEAKASIGMAIKNFSLKKKIELLFWDSKVYGTFEVVLRTEASAALDISGSYTAETAKQLFRKSLSGVGWEVKIPFVGRVGVGGFAKLDFVADIVFEAGATLSASSVLEKKEKVSFDIIPKFKLSASLLSKSNTGGSGLELKNSFSTALSASITGFAGVRPAAGLELNFGSAFKGDVNLGVKIGVQASLKAKYPPFEAVWSGTRVGICDKCHTVEGKLSLKGKELGVEYSTGSGDKDFTILDDVFEVPFGTYCAVEQTCSMNGLFGSTEGKYFENNPPKSVGFFFNILMGISEITVYHSSKVHGLKIVWIYADTRTRSVSHGNTSGTSSVVALKKSEFVDKVTGHYNSDMILGMTIWTTLGRKFGPFGDSSGSTFEISKSSKVLLGFRGREQDNYISALGAVYA